MNGEIEDLNTIAQAIELFTKEVNKIAAVHTVETALDNVTSTKPNSKIGKQVDKRTTKLDGKTVMKMSEKVANASPALSIAKSTQTRSISTGEWSHCEGQ
ncbi:aldehyde dehydrogenase [Colletotrichum asianum]|uniref:Aldehyde dehydrogenase n=1 Tax=Colletotrichum asianum TaxID=702518 RepID=A0A8H3WFQ9_9PEZI|nr:aldehyde dehydrogenase [Colletotrichum asianum]